MINLQQIQNMVKMNEVQTFYKFLTSQFYVLKVFDFWALHNLTQI